MYVYIYIYIERERERFVTSATSLSSCWAVRFLMLCHVCLVYGEVSEIIGSSVDVRYHLQPENT